jgi:hypothetical protein
MLTRRRLGIDLLRRVRAAHDLRVIGLSSREIAARLDISADTAQRYCRLARPTDQELAEAATLVARPQVSGRRPDLRIKTDPTTFTRLVAEAEAQDCSLSELGDLAIQFYLEAAEIYRSGSWDRHLNLRGYLRRAKPRRIGGRKPERKLAMGD